MTKRLLSERHGVRTWYVPQTDGTFLIETEQDVAPHLDWNKALYNEDDAGWFDRKREQRRVAHIPDVVIVKWLNDYGINVFDRDHRPAVTRLLNDPDWRYLRTGPGHLDPRKD